MQMATVPSLSTLAPIHEDPLQLHILRHTKMYSTNIKVSFYPRKKQRQKGILASLCLSNRQSPFFFPMQRCAHKYGIDRADFLTVYLREVHAKDEWTFYSYVDINQPKTVYERQLAAKKYVNLSKTKCPIALDFIDLIKNATLENEISCEKAYSAWPDRLYIILKGVIAYVGGVGPNGYKPKEVGNWLEKYFQGNKSKL